MSPCLRLGALLARNTASDWTLTSLGFINEPSVLDLPGLDGFLVDVKPLLSISGWGEARSLCVLEPDLFPA